MASVSAWQAGERPITIAILAMGGDGGGVLSDWIVSLAEDNGYIAQSTSIAGVAQRTGATVYYVELFPKPSDGREPVLSVFAAPGEVDIVMASELMEAARSVLRGFCTPDRSLLITSTHRVYAMTERIALGDGRVDQDELLAAAANGSQRLIGADFSELAVRAGSVISAPLFGALAYSGALPFDRSQFEDTIRASGKGVEKSLEAFALGFDAAAQAPVETETQGTAEPVPVTLGKKSEAADSVGAGVAEAERRSIAESNPEQLVGPALAAQARRVGADFPAAARSTLLYGCERTAVYQDESYTDRYLDRVQRVAEVDSDADGDATLTTEAARSVALWMCYQDTIQVALQKIRRRRLDGIRVEARADSKQPVEVYEYLHPQLEEITDTLPTGVGKRLARSRSFAKMIERATSAGMVVNTTSAVGYSMLWTMARMRPLRPRSYRFAREQAAIDEWLDFVVETARGGDVEFATEIVRCQQVLKGYGETHAHGRESFSTLMAAARALVGNADAAEILRGLHKAALADEDGAALRASSAPLLANA